MLIWFGFFRLGAYRMMKPNRYIPLRKHCKEVSWPTLGQWNWWIYTKNDVASQCIKKLGGRYIIDLDAFEKYLAETGLEGSS